MTTATYDDVLARVRSHVIRLDRPPVVGICGHGGAGKSTLSSRLAADLGVPEDAVVRLDRLKSAAARQAEGIRLLRPETRPLLDLAVWIEMSPESAGVRAVARNRGQGDSEAEIDLWRTRWVPEGHAYATEVDPARLADLVVGPSSCP